MDRLEEYFLQYANDFECSEFVQKCENKYILDDQIYENHIMPIVEDYDECTLYDSLANQLAWRDFRDKHSEEELDAMAKENGGYFVGIYEYEKKYWDEFEKYGVERLEVTE